MLAREPPAHGEMADFHMHVENSREIGEVWMQKTGIGSPNFKWALNLALWSSGSRQDRTWQKVVPQCSAGPRGTYKTHSKWFRPKQPLLSGLAQHQNWDSQRNIIFFVLVFFHWVQRNVSIKNIFKQKPCWDHGTHCKIDWWFSN